MNRTQDFTASQPRPKRRVARPGASSLCFVPNTASAANDHHMGSGSEPPEKPPTGDALRAAEDAFPTAEASPAMLALAAEKLAAVESGRSDRFSARIRIGLGDRSVRHPTSAVRMSEAFLSKIEAAARRVRAAFGETQAKLLLDFQ